MKMFTLSSAGDPLPEGAREELYAAVVQMFMTGVRSLDWTPRDTGVPLFALTAKVVGHEEQSFAGQDGGPVIWAEFRTVEGGSGEMTFIIPRRILRGHFPDKLHELIATVMTADDDYVN